MPIRPEHYKSTCQVCKEEVTFPDFKCKKLPGNHRVEERTYYHMGGQDIRNDRDRRGWAPRLMWAREDKLDGATGKLVNQPPIEVHFQQGGIYVTQDPEIQFHLETNSRAVGWGKAGREQWEKIYLSIEQRTAIAQSELERVNKTLREQNSLLEQTKARAAQQHAPVAEGEADLATIGAGTDGEAALHGNRSQGKRNR